MGKYAVTNGTIRKSVLNRRFERIVVLFSPSVREMLVFFIRLYAVSPVDKENVIAQSSTAKIISRTFPDEYENVQQEIDK